MTEPLRIASTSPNGWHNKDVMSWCCELDRDTMMLCGWLVWSRQRWLTVGANETCEPCHAVLITHWQSSLSTHKPTINTDIGKFRNSKSHKSVSNTQVSLLIYFDVKLILFFTFCYIANEIHVTTWHQNQDNRPIQSFEAKVENTTQILAKNNNITNTNKKFELILTRRVKAYSSSGSVFSWKLRCSL